MKTTSVIAIIFIIVAGFTVYANSLNGGFIWDDEVLVKDNLYIRNPVHVLEFFKGSISTNSGASAFRYYRPVQFCTYMFDYALWNLNARGYHFTNILLHILASLAVFWMVVILFGDRLTAFLTGLFFVIHPVMVEAVSYVSGRSDSLGALFFLISFILYVKALCTGRREYSLFMAAAYILALLSRETSIVLLPLVLFYHYVFGKKLKSGNFFLLAGVTAAYAVLRLTLLKTLIAGAVIPTTVVQRIPGFFAAITGYLRLIFVPVSLHMEYGCGAFSFFDAKVIGGLTIMILAAVYAVSKRKSDRLALFSTGWFFLMLLPVSNIYPAGVYMAEHWLYLPVIGVFLLLARGFSIMYRTGKRRFITTILLASVVMVWGYLTHQQNVSWNNPEKFYERMLKFVPDSVRASNNLANIYYAAGKKEDAVKLYRGAIMKDPENPVLYNNLANVYKGTGREEEAIALFRKAIALNPEYADACYNLGRTYKQLGRREESLKAFQEVIRIDPGYVEKVKAKVQDHRQ